VVSAGRPAPPGSFIDAAGTRLHVVRAGAGPSLVYVHGAKGSFLDFTLSLGPRLAKTYATVAIDRPGSGYSGRPPGHDNSPLRQAAVLRAAAAKLGLRRPLLVGHSLGAAVALAWALDDPDGIAAVVTLGGWAFPVGGPPPWLDRLVRLHTVARLTGLLGRSRLGRPLVDAMLRRAFTPDAVPADYARLAPPLAVADANIAWDGADNQAARAALTALSARYPSLAVPLVILVGDGDRMVPPAVSEHLHALVPGSELVRIRGAGHMPQFTAPDAVLAAIARAAVLGGVEPASA
jgi:pimeloyl-ACP methyl ester carboxylesterase